MIKKEINIEDVQLRNLHFTQQIKKIGDDGMNYLCRNTSKVIVVFK